MGYVGVDVPQELIEAVGLRPLRLAPIDVKDRDEADLFLGPGVGESLRLVLAGLLEGRYPIDFLVLCHDSDQTTRLYTALRVLARREQRPALPIFHFLDLVHLPTTTSAAYNRDRVVELAHVLADWAGRPLTSADLSRAVAAANDRRRLLQRVNDLRRSGALQGSQLLAIIAAGTAMSAAEYGARLAALLAAPPEPVAATGPRVFLLGSEHDRPDVYDALEAAGAAVVGEDHAWGALWSDGLVCEETEPLQALAARYHVGSALGRCHGAAERARCSAADAAAAATDIALAWHRAGDESLAWGLPEESRAFAERGIPLVSLRHRPYLLTAADRDALAEVVA